MFVHEDSEFADLLRIVARDRGLSVPLVEKDYWVTHALWAIHEIGLSIWFKGGTSLSKGFGLIRRFSEDLDLQIEAGKVEHLPSVANWKSTNKGPVATRRAFFEALEGALAIPGCSVRLDPGGIPKGAFGASYQVHYPGEYKHVLDQSLRPFVLLEVGHARIRPFESRPLSGVVHDWLDEKSQLGDYSENRPSCVRCLHPVVTLIEKIDAIAKRYPRGQNPASFIRHYEDAARIIEEEESLPALEGGLKSLIESMIGEKRIRRLPGPDDPAFSLADVERKAELEEAHRAIEPMFWGGRLSLDDAAQLIREWLSKLPCRRELAP